MTDSVTSNPILAWLREGESLSISGKMYKAAADEIERLRGIEAEYIQIHEAMAKLREAFDQFMMDATRPPDEPSAERREYRACGTYWSGVPTAAMPCELCGQDFIKHDYMTHGCPADKTNGGL